MFATNALELPARSAVGEDIRALRRGRGMTIAELAAVIERSIGWLSQVERGQNEPAIRDLRAIALHFRVPISFFFRNADAPEAERGVIVRASARSPIGTREGGLTEELLSPDLSGDFEMILSEFAPGAQSEDVPARQTQEGGYLVSGSLELTIGGRTHALGAGDSFQFRSDIYRWRNPGKAPAVVVWIVSPPVY